jgi:hypothetical protein
MDPPIKKKRGRKSKKELEEIKKLEEEKNTENPCLEQQNEDGLEVEIKDIKPLPKNRGRKPKVVCENDTIPTLKKRGRKSKEKQYGKEVDLNNLAENENIIVHLPLKNNDNKESEENIFNDESFLNYDPSVTVPVESETTGLSESGHSWIDHHDTFTDNDSSLLLDKGPPPENKFAPFPFKSKKVVLPVEKKKVDYTMKMFKDYNTNNDWPTKTDIHCFWDCCEIEGQPFGLPIKYVNNIYYLIGCFSSPECAAAYNFNDSSINNKWYNYSLLNMMCRKLYNNNDLQIKVSPPRQCLQKFGGNLTLKEFRETNINYNKDYNLVYPPIISVIPIQEEVNIRKHNQSRNKSVPIFSNEEKSLKLTRNKPLKNYEFTLDNCMNLQYN